MRNYHFLILGIILFPAASFADKEYQPNPYEFAPEKKIECSWSTMNHQEYQECLKKRKFFENMSEEEKKTWNQNVEKLQQNRRIDQIDRRTR